MTKNISSMAADIASAISEGTKKWTKQRKAEERKPAARQYRDSAYGTNVAPNGQGDDAGLMKEGYIIPVAATLCLQSPPVHVLRAQAFAGGCTRSLNGASFTETCCRNSWRITAD